MGCAAGSEALSPVGAVPASWDGDWTTWGQELLQTVGSADCGSYIDLGLNPSCAIPAECLCTFASWCAEQGSSPSLVPCV